MALREIIRIDEEKCDGCGDCVTACAEGAIQIVGGKAVLVSEIYCDGFGVCVGECPLGAIIIEEREAEEFDESATQSHVEKMRPKKSPQPPAPIPASAHARHGGCPGSRMQMMTPTGSDNTTSSSVRVKAELTNWPIQLHLMQPQAPFLNGADLLIAADCVPYAFGDFHEKLLKGKALAIACPKLDDTSPYIEKLASMFRNSGVGSVTVARMEVPCCMGITQITLHAIEISGVRIPVCEVTLGIKGEIIDERQLVHPEMDKITTG